jgi:hypothetical protein
MDGKDCLIVTTSQKAGSEQLSRAREFAQNHQLPFYVRTGAMPAMAAEYGFTGAFIIAAHEVFLWHQGREIRFHINMAKLRITTLERGGRDRMQAAMDLQKGDRLLDCTLGMGTDAIVASYIVGEEGSVTGLECNYALQLLVSYGLRAQVFMDDLSIGKPMQRIETFHTESLAYMRGIPAAQYDIVYFDPMFRRPQRRSSGLEGVRHLANQDPLHVEHITQALRIAKRAVVLKERPESAEFKRLGFQELPFTRGASVNYGVIRISPGGITL